MQTTAPAEPSHAHPEPSGHGDHDHYHPGFWSKYIFSTDHKTIGIQYGITALIFLLVGFALMMLMRFQLAYPGQPLPAADLLRKLFSGSMGLRRGT